MRVSFNWLRELIDISLGPEEVADLLTGAGFEVEGIEDRRTWAAGVVLGHVISCEPHPGADRLRVCQVDLGQDAPATIVCGASNVQCGQYVAAATPGTYLPWAGGLTIRPTKLRGVRSEGMICSLAELGLAKESSGIYVFSPEGLPPVGSDARPLLGLDDLVLEVVSTANRADTLSMVGLAREVAALTGAPLHLPTPPATSPPAGMLEVQLPEPAACPAYRATLLEQVQVAPSPPWLQHRLQAAGIRTINNVVDITNYVLLEWGQPLHGFDWDRLEKVAGGKPVKIEVRFAQPGETLQTLDGQERSLNPLNLVISATDQPVALAGLMGGAATEIHNHTTRVLLEAAVFEGAVIRRSARSQGLRTEASARYERGVNEAALDLACRRALQLLQTLTGAVLKAQSPPHPAFPIPSPPPLGLRLGRLQQILGPTSQGEPLGPATVEQVLTALSCTLSPGPEPDSWSVVVPPYRRRDLEREIDLIEEVARVYGYDNFADTLPQETTIGGLSPDQEHLRRIRQVLRGAGLTELVHYSLTKPTPDTVVIVNPLLADYAALRHELLPGLIEAYQFNLEQDNRHLNGFEIGRVFQAGPDQLGEYLHLGGIVGGDPRPNRWPSSGQEQPLTWFEAKGILDGVFEALNCLVSHRQTTAPWLHPGRTSALWLGNTRLGVFGQLHPQVRQDRGLPAAVYGFELCLAPLLECLQQPDHLTPWFRAFSTYPASERDIAFFVPLDVSVGEVQAEIEQVGRDLLERAYLFDEYRGEAAPPGQRSLAFRLVYRSPDRTLTDGDVDPVQTRIRQALVQKFAAQLRS